MNNEIEYTTTEQQIKKLKSQNLIIYNEKEAKHALEVYGYSNLIKSYREPYTIIDSGKKVFRSGISFEQIFSLYMLDKNLRNAVMASMLDLEEHIKEAAADVIANAFGTHPDDYLKFRNYQNKTKRNERFTLKSLLEKMNQTLNSEKDPIYHYQTVHSIVPPWILFKGIYFTTIVNFIDQFKAPQLDALTDKLYDKNFLTLSPDAFRKLLLDTLFICIDYRNLAAHGGRTYTFSSHNRLRSKEIFPKEVGPSFGFSQLLFLLQLFVYKAPVNHLHNVLSRELDRHCSAYPQDVTYLGQILNIDIVTTALVYVSQNSNKFHINRNCSGIKNVSQIELTQAIEEHYVPCKRCANHITIN